MESEEYYESISFYVIELSKIKSELKKHETEYHPEKVRSLINAYKFTLIKVIQNCKGFLKTYTEDCDLEKVEKVESTLKGCSKLLKSISRD